MDFYVVSIFQLFFKQSITHSLTQTHCISRISILSSGFFFTFNIPGIGIKWLHYILPISTGIAIPLALLVKDEYRRTTVDVESETPEGLSRAESPQDFGHLRID